MGKLRRWYTGRCAVRTTPPAPMITIGRGRAGMAHACRRCVIVPGSERARPIGDVGNGRLLRCILIQMKDRLHGGPPFVRTRLCGRFLERLHEAFPFRDSLTRRLVRCKRGAVVEAIAHLEDHHKATAEEIDVHPIHTCLPETGLNFGPHIAMQARVCLDDSGIALQVHRQDMSAAHWFSTPPSRGYACPVTNDASSEHRYSARYATSSGDPMRPIGWYSESSCSTAASRPG